MPIKQKGKLISRLKSLEVSRYLVWRSALPFGLCIRTYAVFARVCCDWRTIVSTGVSWSGSVVDLTGISVPQPLMQSLCNMWHKVDSFILQFPHLSLQTHLRKPFIFSSEWSSHIMGAQREWQRINVIFRITCFVRLSEWPVLSLVSLRMSTGMCIPNHLHATQFSVGWTTASTASQLARVICDEQMRGSDYLIHVCMLNFPNICSHHYHPRANLMLQYIHGSVLHGFDEHRVVEMPSPFHFCDKFDMLLEMDACSNKINITVNDEFTVSTPSYFVEAGAPTIDDSLPQWRFFMYAQDLLPPRVQGILLNVDVRSRRL